MNNNLRRIYEIIWLLLSVATFGLAIYDWFKNGWNNAVWQFAGMSLLALGIFFLRRKQRKDESEKEEKTQQ